MRRPNPNQNAKKCKCCFNRMKKEPVEGFECFTGGGTPLRVCHNCIKLVRNSAGLGYQPPSTHLPRLYYNKPDLTQPHGV